MLKLKHILASMNYFDSDMSNNTNMEVYFDGKDRILYLCLADNITHNLYFQIRASDNSSTCTFTTGKSVLLMEHL